METELTSGSQSPQTDLTSAPTIDLPAHATQVVAGETVQPSRPAQTGSGVALSMPLQDLLHDSFLLKTPRIEFNGQTVPSLKGIPLIAKLGQGGMGAVYYGF